MRRPIYLFLACLYFVIAIGIGLVIHENLAYPATTYFRLALVGGGSALDAVAVASLTDGDRGFVFDSGRFFAFLYTAADTSAENFTAHPLKIRPNDNAYPLPGVWIEQEIPIATVGGPSAAALTYYVDSDTGDDTTGTGTSALPFATIMKSVNSLPRILNTAATINVDAGNYDESLDLRGIMTNGLLKIQAKSLAGDNLYFSGTATGGGASTLIDTGRTWTVNQFAGGKVWIFDGTGTRQLASVLSNTANTLTVTAPWAVQPASGSRYSVIAATKIASAGKDIAILAHGQTNVEIDGFWIEGYVSYGVYVTSGGTLTLYNNYVDCPKAITVIGANNMSVLNNYLSVAVASDYAGLVPIAVPYCTIRGNYFKSELVGSGKAIYLRYGSVGNFLYSATFGKNQIENFDDGVTVDGNAQWKDADSTSMVFSGCGDNYTRGNYEAYSINYGNDVLRIGAPTATPSAGTQLLVKGKVEADSYLEYSPLYTGNDALRKLAAIRPIPGTEKNGWAEVDHSTLPDGVMVDENNRDLAKQVQMIQAAVLELDRKTKIAISCLVGSVFLCTVGILYGRWGRNK